MRNDEIPPPPPSSEDDRVEGLKSLADKITGGMKVIKVLSGLFGAALLSGATWVGVATVEHASAIRAIATDVQQIEEGHKEHARDEQAHPPLSTRVTTLEALVPQIQSSLENINKKLDAITERRAARRP